MSTHEALLGPLHPVLHVAVVAARSAARLNRAAAADPPTIQIRHKKPNDFVTQVDVATERVIVETLLAAFPAHSVRAEESQQAHGAQGADHVWIVDPLDGTNNFIHGYPAYSVSIALSVRGCIEQAVVLDVNRGDVFHATRGAGAYCNAQRLQVSAHATLAQALMGTSCPYQPGEGFARSLQMFGAVMERVAGIRRSGSAALDLAWVAAGYCDAFFDLGLNAWDVAAGSLLVTEAGGRVGDFRGGPDFLETRECMAGNAALFTALAAVLASYSRQGVAATAQPEGGVGGSG